MLKNSQFFLYMLGVLYTNCALASVGCINGMYSTQSLNAGIHATFFQNYFDHQHNEYWGGDFRVGIANYRDWVLSGSLCFSCSTTGPTDDAHTIWGSRGFLPLEEYSQMPVGAFFQRFDRKALHKHQIQLANTHGPSDCMCPENEVFVHDLLKHGYVSLDNAVQFRDIPPLYSNIHIAMRRYWDKMKHIQNSTLSNNTLLVMKENPCFACPLHSKSSRGSMVHDIRIVNISVDETRYAACACDSGYEYITNTIKIGGECVQCAVGTYSYQYLVPLQNSWTQQDSVGVYSKNNILEFSSDFNPGTSSKTIHYTNEYIRNNLQNSHVFDFSGQIRRTGLGRHGTVLDANLAYRNTGCLKCPFEKTTLMPGSSSADDCIEQP